MHHSNIIVFSNNVANFDSNTKFKINQTVTNSCASFQNFQGATSS